MAESQELNGDNSRSIWALPEWAKATIPPELQDSVAAKFSNLQNESVLSTQDLGKTTSSIDCENKHEIKGHADVETVTNSKTDEDAPQKEIAATGKSGKKNDKTESKEKDCINLLLVGKTGNGKSATGNSILNRIYFESKGASESVTQEVKYEMVEYKKRHIKVVDGPGVGDTHHINDVVKATELVMAKMKDAVLLNPDGYNAFLLVIKYGNRFTAEDKECVRILKAIFGPDFVKNYCILVVTNGDNFKIYKKDTKTTFKDWCKEQEGIFKELLTECDNRVVLFDNISKEKAVRKKQMNKLLELISKLQHGERRYTSKHFEFAIKNREHLMAEIKEPHIRQKALENISIILQKLDEINKKDIRDQSEHLVALLEETDGLSTYVKEIDNETGVLRDILINIDGISKRLYDKIEYNERLCKEYDTRAKQEEELRKAYIEEVRKKDDEFRMHWEKKMLEDEKRREELLRMEENIRASKRKMEEDFQIRQRQLQVDIENERLNAQKVMLDKERELQELLASNANDKETIKFVEEERAMLDAKLASMLHEIEQKENKMAITIEEERLEASKLIQQEQSKHDEAVAEMEKQMNDLKLEHDAEKEKMTLYFAILLHSFAEKMKHLFQLQQEACGAQISEMKAKYSEMKNVYDQEMRKMGKKPDAGCKQQ